MKTDRFACSVMVVAMAWVAGCASDKTSAQGAASVAETPRPVKVTVPAPMPTPTPAAAQVQTSTPTPAQIPAPTVGAAPEISFEMSEHDFGSVGPSTSHAVDFKFSNAGNSILKIERFHTPCGCTIPELDKRDYEPGESGVIKVRYNAPASAAVENKPIYVYTNDPKNPQYELAIKASVEVNVAITPEDVSLLLDQPNGGMPALTIRSKDGKDFAVTSVTVSNEIMTIPFDRNKRAFELVLEPKVDMAKLKNTPTGLIQVRTDHPQSGTLMVRFNAKPLFEISRPRIILQNIVPGEQIVRDVWIRSNYDQKVQVESFSSSNGMMSIDSQNEEGNHLQIMVKILPPATPPAASNRYITDELTIHLTNGQELTIRLSGWFKLN